MKKRNIKTIKKCRLYRYAKNRAGEGKPMDKEAVLKRMRKMGLDPAKVRL
ncbi:MAG: hypothetical protein WA139_01830 [Candidatus Aenigmatarchaeota archaeon]